MKKMYTFTDEAEAEKNINYLKKRGYKHLLKTLKNFWFSENIYEVWSDHYFIPR